MHSADEPAPGSAEDVFASFLEQIEAGEQVDFEALCRQHPDVAGKLRRIHLRWLAMTRAFGELSRTPSATAPDASSAAVDALMARLRTGAGRPARYAIGTEIARGAMGRIVQAWDEELRREVALKVHRGDTTDARQQRRFLEEAQIAAQLDHPGIVPIHELGVDPEGRPFFSMRLVRGADLAEILALANDGKGEWTRTRLLHVLLRVCEAMAFAHARGVVHRDLKPANIMVGRFHETYVMDWGLAHVRGAEGADALPMVDSLRAAIAGEGDDSPLLTRHGDVLGTPAYMAPEQALGGSVSCSPAVDVYALGAILWHVLAGRMPFAEGSNPTATKILARVRAGPPEPLSSDVPPELRAICEKAMARSPAERYATVEDLGSDLRSYLEVRTVRAYATGRFAELRKWIARNRALTATVLLLLLVGIAAGIAVTAQWLRADANAARLRTEVDRNAFRSARQSLHLDNSSEGGDLLWRTHLEGRMPRASQWALWELFERDPYLVTLPWDYDYRAVSFAPHAGAVLVAGPDRIHVREATNLAHRAEIGTPGDVVTALAAPRDAPWALAGTRRGELLVLDLANNRVLRREKVHGESLDNLTMTGPRSFVSGGQDGRVYWWNDPEAAPELMLERSVPITALAAHPTGDGFLAGDRTGAVIGRSRSRRWSLDYDVGPEVADIAFGEKWTDVWVGCTDHDLYYLDLTKVQDLIDRKIPTWPSRNGTYRQIARDRDGTLLAGGWWRIDRRSPDGTERTLVSLRGISQFDLDVDTRRIVTTSWAGLGLVDLATPDRRLLPESRHVAMSANGTRYAMVQDGKVIVRDVDTQEITAEFKPERTGWLHISPAGDLIAICRRSPRRVHVHDAATGAERFVVDGPSDMSSDEFCAFRADGSELAVRTGDDRIRRYRCNDGALLAEYVRPGRPNSRLSWSHDGVHLAELGRRSTTVRVYDVRDGTFRDEVFVPLLPTGEPTYLSTVAIAPDGSRLAVGTRGNVLIREKDGKTNTIAAHPGTIWSLQFAANDPGLLISSGAYSGIAFWDLDTLECCYQTERDVATDVQVSDDLSTLLCQLPSGYVMRDLTYRHRHIAGNLEYFLDRHRALVAAGSPRERDLRAWAAAVLARPWPRWK